MTILILVLMIGAIARLTHMVTTDVISEPFRSWVRSKEAYADNSVDVFTFTTLLGCPWCAGFWISCGVAALTWAFGDHLWLQFIWAALTASYAVGYMEEKL